MRIRILAVSAGVPTWVRDGMAEYQKRLPRNFPVKWTELPSAKRQGDSVKQLMVKEADTIRKQLKPDERLVILDVGGTVISTEGIAQCFADWQMDGSNVVIIIGGPDGIDPTLLAKADACWSLGRITLPHSLVRVVLAEQIYRAWSINTRHPYHRA